MTNQEGRFRYPDGQRFPDDREDWESGDYERFYGGPSDEDLERLPSYVEEALENYEVDPGHHVSEPVEQRTHGWRYDNTGYYAYILFDGDAALRDDVVGKLKAAGVFSMARGRSYKLAE